MGNPRHVATWRKNKKRQNKRMFSERPGWLRGREFFAIEMLLSVSPLILCATMRSTEEGLERHDLGLMIFTGGVPAREHDTWECLPLRGSGGCEKTDTIELRVLSQPCTDVLQIRQQTKSMLQHALPVHH